MTDALSLEFEVAASPAHAFDDLDGTAGHVVAGRPRPSPAHPAALAFEPYVGGRIVETATGRRRAHLGRGAGLGATAPAGLHLAPVLRPDRGDRGPLTFVPPGTPPSSARPRPASNGSAPPGEARRENTRAAWSMLLREYAAAV